MTFLECIDSRRRVGINDIPKDVALLLTELYPDRFPNPKGCGDSIFDAIEMSDEMVCVDFRDGLQYSFLSISRYDDSFHSFIDMSIDWYEIELPVFNTLAEDETIDLETLI